MYGFKSSEATLKIQPAGTLQEKKTFMDLRIHKDSFKAGLLYKMWKETCLITSISSENGLKISNLTLQPPQPSAEVATEGWSSQLWSSPRRGWELTLPPSFSNVSGKPHPSFKSRWEEKPKCSTFLQSLCLLLNNKKVTIMFICSSSSSAACSELSARRESLGMTTSSLSRQGCENGTSQHHKHDKEQLKECTAFFASCSYFPTPCWHPTTPLVVGLSTELWCKPKQEN